MLFALSRRGAGNSVDHSVAFSQHILAFLANFRICCEIKKNVQSGDTKLTTKSKQILTIFQFKLSMIKTVWSDPQIWIICQIEAKI